MAGHDGPTLGPAGAWSHTHLTQRGRWRAPCKYANGRACKHQSRSVAWAGDPHISDREVRRRLREIHWLWELANDSLAHSERAQRRSAASRPAGPAGVAPTWAPPTDVYVVGGCWRVTLALPGVDPASVEVHLEGDTLTVQAERSTEWLATVSRLERLEIPFGRFERSITLPQIALRIARIEFLNGCLDIWIAGEEPGVGQ